VSREEREGGEGIKISSFVTFAFFARQLLSISAAAKFSA